MTSHIWTLSYLGKMWAIFNHRRTQWNLSCNEALPGWQSSHALHRILTWRLAAGNYSRCESLCIVFPLLDATMFKILTFERIIHWSLAEYVLAVGKVEWCYFTNWWISESPKLPWRCYLSTPMTGVLCQLGCQAPVIYSIIPALLNRDSRMFPVVMHILLAKLPD